MQTGDIKNIKFAIRRKARENVNYFPESGFTSADLSKCLFQSKNSQTLCEYHRKSKDTAYKSDTLIEFHGMGFRGESVKNAPDVRDPRPNHLHCGCPIDEVVLEYFLWKTTRVRSSNPAVGTDFARSGLERLKPSTRAFWNKSIRDFTGLTTEDFLSKNYGSPLYSCRLAMIQLHTQVQRLKALHAPIMVEVSFPPPDISQIPANLIDYGRESGVFVTGEELAEEWKNICANHRVMPLPLIES